MSRVLAVGLVSPALAFLYGAWVFGDFRSPALTLILAASATSYAALAGYVAGTRRPRT